MGTKFYPDRHNPLFFSGTAVGTRSLFTEQSALAASAYLSAYGTAMLQSDNRPSGLYAEIPNNYGLIVRSGNTSATESSNHWFLAQAGLPGAHPFTYANDIAARYLASGWTPTAR